MLSDEIFYNCQIFNFFFQHLEYKCIHADDSPDQEM